ncbi:phosphatidylglycerophosphatase A [Phreatobacter sp.]|uniref:phosphatidylglycerophosphatase A family protein n=1 Tax=Phreatobacter sp. TaxID=1966341 RepID=UPI0022BD1B85|nr:phosphatidylglycerophosphatase A [Phreatobacter sp.]MCZ8313842.1 phosphatidylglycerophosphatase A [Phreatobacter sp.]
MAAGEDKDGVAVDGAFMVRHPASLVALVGGAGLAPVAPGTFGALVGLPLGLALDQLPLPVALALIAAGFVLGIWACGLTAHRAGVHDHGAIVYDETWAMAAVVVLTPAGWPVLLAGFVAFRFFDIVKPWPIGLIDRKVAGGLGIMLDDAVAAIYAAALVTGVVVLGGF